MNLRKKLIITAAITALPALALAQGIANAPGDTKCPVTVQPPGPTQGDAAYTAPPCEIEGQPIETRIVELGFGKPNFKEQTRAPYHKSKTSYKVTVITDKLDYPWSLQFLPSGKILVTEKVGAMRIVSTDGTISEPLKNLPKIAYSGDAGLMDVQLDPNFEQNHYIYFNYDRPERDDTTRVVLTRATLDEAGLALNDIRVIYRSNEARNTLPSNLGNGRIVFAKDGTIFLSIGARQSIPRDSAQNVMSTLGKIVHITREGAAVPTNPFYGKPGYVPELYAIGFRTPESFTMDAKGQLWEGEHGARGGDEMNLIKPGQNYGWPLTSHGIEYSGEVIGGGNTHLPGLTEPTYYWNPVIGPGCIQFYNGKMFPEWKGHAFVCALRGRMLLNLTLNGANKVVSEEPLLVDFHTQVRDMRVAPDGSIYVIQNVSKAAKMLRISAN